VVFAAASVSTAGPLLAAGDVADGSAADFTVEVVSVFDDDLGTAADLATSTAAKDFGEGWPAGWLDRSLEAAEVVAASSLEVLASRTNKQH